MPASLHRVDLPRSEADMNVFDKNRRTMIIVVPFVTLLSLFGSSMILFT